MNICVVGLGFVGLSMATVMASKGFTVRGIEIDQDKYSLIKKAEVPFFEPKVKDLLLTTLGKQFEVTNNIKDGVSKSEIIFLCVGTPSKLDGSADLSFIKQVSQEIGQVLKKNNSFKIISVKSTVPPTTTTKLVKTTLEKISNKKSGVDFGLCMNPEFLREGSAIDDMFSPHLIVIGSEDTRTKETMNNFYEKMYGKDLPTVLNTTITNAELVKYANNAFLATKISFINTIANICNQIEGADVEVIAKAIGFDPRIGPQFLKAGPGFGGSCLPKDVSGFLNFSLSLGYNPVLLESTQKVNQEQPSLILKMVEKKIKNFENKTISVLGLAFKKDTDDIRESVSLKIVNLLLQKKAKIKVHDPMAIENFKKIFQNKIDYCKNSFDCIKSSDCCIILTDWDEYSNFTENDFKKHMRTPCVIDARRMLDPNKMHSIEYSAIGYGKNKDI